jgi:hypothetical protein
MPSPTNPERRLLQISPKLSLRFQKTGSGSPLVLMHTIRTQLEYFRSLAPILAESYTVYAMDLPGHGRSPIDSDAAFDEPYLRQGVIGFLEKLNVTDVTLVFRRFSRSGGWRATCSGILGLTKMDWKNNTSTRNCLSRWSTPRLSPTSSGRIKTSQTVGRRRP